MFSDIGDKHCQHSRTKIAGDGEASSPKECPDSIDHREAQGVMPTAPQAAATAIQNPKRNREASKRSTPRRFHPRNRPKRLGGRRKSRFQGSSSVAPGDLVIDLIGRQCGQCRNQNHQRNAKVAPMRQKGGGQNRRYCELSAK